MNQPILPVEDRAELVSAIRAALIQRCMDTHPTCPCGQLQHNRDAGAAADAALAWLGYDQRHDALNRRLHDVTQERDAYGAALASVGDTLAHLAQAVTAGAHR